ncbi:Lrp/AsnC family transcriptional regulator [Flavobacteriaceae bacterium]|jgi:Lrp/AsnC family transcriptional regulator, leucine-responsive regulatory protein|nr:ArsR family transcriptional regulator [Flavobacteriaceae bacterium]MCP4801304.1 Lrp/AsnC family transcriptional regulator [Bacteroidota bacterium]MDB2471765.1 Lrp/AsnC family transcriptional regulator [Flavobacteriaceae bacterium]MDC1051846.1 Lrp/AsnC family transcriptional regulator [Flavobacteriaceae bacterium]MDG1380043.1 Lrp/AsnC family transcriptional regulator [Flavobacteriaceae bacterium]|tara:strand:+ start:355 stop:804 length:450 start_codon:yes stop_codon:yes gene_type:complete
MKVDLINWKILKLLQKNARRSNTEIASYVGISSPAVAERIRKLEDAGIILGYRTKVEPLELGYQLRALVTVRAFMGRLKPFLQKIKTFDEVINCYRITGNENIVLEVILINQKHLEQFIDQLITYGETKTQIILSNVIDDRDIQQHISP